MLRLEKYEDRFAKIEPASLQMVIADPPFGVSRLAGGEREIAGFEDHIPFRRELAEWDFEYSPHKLIELAAVATQPGGWLVIKSGDVNFGMVREMGERSAHTLKYYIDFLVATGVLDHVTEQTYERLENIPKLWKYHATVVWHRTNPVPRVRVSTPLSSVEYLQILKRLDEKGKSVKPVAFNFLNQTEDMHNFIQVVEGPICLGTNRLYWHVVKDEVIPCKRKGCYLCNDGLERRSHPTQTPLHVWNWIFRRFTVPGMRVYDPCAGVGTTIVANLASKFGLDIFGSEMEAEYVKAHNLWIAGGWQLPSLPDDTRQAKMF